MLLTGEEGNEFQLNVTGYEFPTGTWNWHDANWLVISMRVKAPQGSWQASGPYLLTEEVEQLAKWLAEQSEGPSGSDQIDFMEPDLAFRVASSAPESVLIRVVFELEFLPPWARGREVEDDEEEVWVELMVKRKEVLDAAVSLRSELRKFPWRYPDRPDLRPRVVTPKGRRLSNHVSEQIEPDGKT